MSGAHLVLAHGFTQTARSWDRLRVLLTDRINGLACTAVDLPGHGEADRVRGDLWATADYLTSCGGVGCYVGYSMGGRVALHAALSQPDLVTALVLISSTAGIDDDAERLLRRESDTELAARIETIGVERFLDEWLASPLFAGLDETAQGLRDRLRNTATGLAASLRATGTGTQQPLWDRLDEIRCPTLVLVGEHDQKFRALGERMCSGIPGAKLHVVAGSGHSAHLEQPELTAELLADFVGTLRATESASDGESDGHR